MSDYVKNTQRWCMATAIMAVLILGFTFTAIIAQDNKPASNRPVPLFYVTYTEDTKDKDRIQIVTGEAALFDLSSMTVMFANDKEKRPSLKFANKSIEQATRYLLRSVDAATVELGADAVYNLDKNEFLVSGVAVAEAKQLKATENDK